MVKDVKLKQRKRRNKIMLLQIIVIFSILMSYLLIKYWNYKVTPLLMNYAESETKKITTLVINNAVTKQLASTLSQEELFNIEKNQNDEVTLVTYNSVNVTRMLSTITNLIQLNLKSIEEGNVDLVELPQNSIEDYNKKIINNGIIYEVPIGTITTNAFLSNLGPKIPIKLNLIGDVISNIETKVTNYGINNALLEIGVYVEVSAKINLPFISKTVKVSNVIPISMKVIEGKVPQTYLNGYTTNSNFIEKVPKKE